MRKRKPSPLDAKTAQPKTLLVIPSVAKHGVEQAVREDRHPTMDYFALQTALNADILDYAVLEAEGDATLVRLARRAGRDAALAALAYSKRKQYDIIYSNAENVSFPLAFLLKRHRTRPLHILIGHRLTPPKKKPFFRALHPQMDAIFVYSEPQREYGVRVLGIPERKLHCIPFHADHRFYRPMPSAQDAPPRLISGAGLEWRDYPTLIEAVRGMDVELRLGAASPWSKHQNETESMTLPPNVHAQRYEYDALRRLYADSRFVVVPLYENDFQAGITTILEGMAMGKAIVTTRTQGSANAVRDGESGQLVAPGDITGWRTALQDLLDNPEKAEQMGRTGRALLEADMTLDHWVERIRRVALTLTQDT